ncbi:MAG: hypothetical protein Kow00107_01930 [Planctomycetota bacterium]
MDEKRLEFRTGLAVVIALIILAALTIFAGGLNFLNDYYVIKAQFRSAGGVKKGAPVRMAGVEIGRVQNISFRQETDKTTYIEFELEILRGYKVNTDAVVAITSDSLLGERFLEITPGVNQAFLAPGESMPQMGQTPGSLEDALKAVPSLVDSLKLALDSVNKIIADPKVQGDFRAGLESLSKAASNAESLLRSARELIESNTDDVRKTVENVADASEQAKQLVSSLHEIRTEVYDGIKFVRAEMESFSKRINDPEMFAKINRALDKFEKLPDRLDGLVASIEKLANDDAAKVMTNAIKITEEISFTIAQLRIDLEEISASIKQTIALTREGEGLVAALLTDRKLKEKLDDVLDQGLYLLEHPVMFILKGGYDKREEKPEQDEDKQEEKPKPEKSQEPDASPKPKATISSEERK